MTWTPTEGERRADALMREMLDSAKALDVPLASAEFPMHHARIFGMIAKALDQALAEVPAAAREALDKAMMDNFPGTLAGNPQSSGLWVPVGNGNGNGHANPDDYSELPTYKGAPVEFDRIDETNVLPEVVAGRGLDGTVVMAIIPASEEAPKKRRGRPPGSKAKAAKAKRKSAKAIKAELYPVDAPVAETVAPVAATVTEQIEVAP